MLTSPNFRKRFFVSLVFALLFNFSTAWAQEGIKPLLFKDGQTVQLSRSYSLEELKAGVVINAVEGLEIAGIYLVRGARPIKALKLKDRQEMQAFELYSWATGKDKPAAGKATALPNSDVKAGDRIAFDATYKGEPVSFTIKVQ
ncbi:hypothetical protein [Rufibacter immobilis]|uniref:hypothetical protein n=1 Tax=Rufibacter immobilis TaxID=1348778 RepID=UPI0035EF4FC0